jgi:hypothetical protein
LVEVNIFYWKYRILAPIEVTSFLKPKSATIFIGEELADYLVLHPRYEAVLKRYSIKREIATNYKFCSAGKNLQ